MKPALPVVLRTESDLRAWRQARAASSCAFVPTMGALHEGHCALVRRAREIADLVIVSIFVNPLQFGAGEDFDRYPRTLETDVAALEGLADAVFAPDQNVVYPPGMEVPRFTAGPVGATYEGAARPGHFDGMLTVVARLFDLIRPDIAVFGQKDAQQVFLVRELIRDHFPQIRLEVVETVRERDGLAMSSRNRFLTVDDRRHAGVLSEAMRLASSNPMESLARMRELVTSEPGVELDYLDAVDARTFSSVASTDEIEPGSLLTYVVAARVGSTRLLDTVDVFAPK